MYRAMLYLFSFALIARVAGGELFEKLSKEEIISEKEAVFFVKQILQGVRCMHKKGILHLDLKVSLVFKHNVCYVRIIV